MEKYGSLLVENDTLEKYVEALRFHVDELTIKIDWDYVWCGESNRSYL